MPSRGVPCRQCAEREETPHGGGPPDPVRRGSDTESRANGEPESITVPATVVASRRMVRARRHQPTEFAPWLANARDQLDELGPTVTRLYLIGDRPDRSAEGVRRWAHGEPLPAGWDHHPRGHHTSGHSPVFRFVRADGPAVEIHRAAAWFGDRHELDPATAAEAWDRLGRMIGRAFDEGQLFATPATTGRYLWSRTIPPGHSWPVLDPELQELIRSTSGQGRIELRPLPADTIPRFVEYDGRMMYGALCWGLAGGNVTHDTGDTYEGQTRGRYRVTFQVPRDWTHVGILGAPAETGGWHYPSRPGQRAQSWVDGAELGIAIAQGWRVKIHERILFDGYRGTGPLDRWAKTLIRLRERAAELVEHGRMAPAVGELVAAGIRSIIVQGIGAFQGRQRTVTRSSSSIAEVPAGAVGRHVVDGDHVWTETIESGLPSMNHPEWSTAIWARARARLLICPTGQRHAPAGALALDPATILAFRTDALYLTEDPRWPDDGAAGRLRHTQTIEGPHATPRDVWDLLALQQGER